MIECGAINPQTPEIVCKRPGEGTRSNHPEHTGWFASDHLRPSEGQWIDWSNPQYVKIESTARVGRSNPLKYRQTIEEIARRTRGGTNEEEVGRKLT